MTQSPRIRIRMPDRVAPAQVFTIRALIAHPMETGLRIDRHGRAVPRRIINRFTCALDDQTIIDIEIQPAISADPYFEFDAKADQSGRCDFAWYDDNGQVYRASRDIRVE